MAVLRKFFRRPAPTTTPPPPPSSSSMGSSMVLSTSTSSNSSSERQKNVPELGIERRSSKCGSKTPRFFFWTLTHSDKKAKTAMAGSVDSSSPRTPDSSRSVSFEGAESWPWIDDVDYSDDE